MAPPSIGTPRQRTLRSLTSYPQWVHPDYAYWYDEWMMIRDVCEGEKAIKDAGVTYLPMLDGMDTDEYDAFKTRATFYNFTGRTASAMTGAIFRRQAQYNGFSDKLRKKLEDMTKDGRTFETFAMETAEEVIKLGRAGVLIDMPEESTTEPRPYMTLYTAEQIADWEEATVKGRLVPVKIVLREVELIRDPRLLAPTWAPVYRVLFLEGGVYKQRIYKAKDPSSVVEVTISDEYLFKTIVPLVRGEPLDYIPFQIFGPMLGTLDIEKPTMFDIARLNVSHYNSYAALEHGRFYTGFPIYHVEAPANSGETDADFEIGSARVWVTPAGAKPGILEMNGQGLKFLVEALDVKEQQAASLGGRMMGIRGQAVSESDNQLKISERNEQSVLLKITLGLDKGFTRLLRWWATMHDMSKEETASMSIEFNKDFLFDGVGAREFRAIHAMYKDGVIPIDIVYHYLRKSSVIPDWMNLDEFKRLLNSMESFPNNADVEARSEGFADAKSRDAEDLTLEEQDFTAEQSALDRKATEKQTAITAKANANRPKPATPFGQ